MGDVFEEEAEQAFTIDEYIQGMEEEELEADLVLGGDDGKECTYTKGYMKRQAIFSCLTCTPEGNAGVCTACSLACHDGHEVVELWTKRSFKCDCGNAKFGVFACKLFANKDPENEVNAYNHNFKGLYCTCGRPYPDPDAEDQVEMIQCCACEDWFHENHLGLGPSEEIPRNEEGEPVYGDFICQDCAVACSFLKLYPSSIWAETGTMDAAIENGSSSSSMPEKNTSTCESPKLDRGVNDSDAVAKLREKDIHDSECLMKGTGINQETKLYDTSKDLVCVLGLDLLEATIVLEKKPMFLSKAWRDLLCRCRTCKLFYTKKGIMFLVDKEDSMEEYEKVAKQKRAENLQQKEVAELDFLDKLDHVQKIKILSGIADIKNEFQSFMENVDPSKPVTADDIRQVFGNIAKKRQRFL